MFGLAVYVEDDAARTAFPKLVSVAAQGVAGVGALREAGSCLARVLCERVVFISGVSEIRIRTCTDEVPFPQNPCNVQTNYQTFRKAKHPR
jgi:hypothetical protein